MSIQSFIKRVCVQTAVYWGNPRSDGYNTIYDEPVEIKCRWDGSTKLITDAKGNQIVAVAQVLVTQDLDIDGVLFLGTLMNLVDLDFDEEDPTPIPDAYKIKKLDKNPEFRSTDKFVKVAWL
jgi:hypothetical protein